MTEALGVCADVTIIVCGLIFMSLIAMALHEISGEGQRRM